MLVIIGKIFLSLIFIFIFLYVSKQKIFLTASNKKLFRFLLSMLAASRLFLFFIFVFAFHGSATSDVLVYFEEAHAVWLGKIPLIDIKTAYGPIFPYIGGLLTSIWDNAMIFILISILFEFVAFIFWFKFSEQNFSNGVTRRSALLYICNPLAVCNVPISGQNHIWLAAALAASFWLMSSSRMVASGLMLGLSIVGVKFLSLIFAPVLAVSTFFTGGAARSLKWITSFLLIPIVVYFLLLRSGLDLAEQIRFHAHYNSSGNIPFLLTIFNKNILINENRDFLNFFGFLFLCTSFLYLVFRGGLRTISSAAISCAFVLLVVLLINAKSFTSYMLLALFPICISISRDGLNKRQSHLLFMFWSLLAAIEPTLWFRLMSEADLSNIISQPSLGSLLFLSVEILLVAGYVYLMRLAFRSSISL